MLFRRKIATSYQQRSCSLPIGLNFIAEALSDEIALNFSIVISSFSCSDSFLNKILKNYELNNTPFLISNKYPLLEAILLNILLGIKCEDLSQQVLNIDSPTCRRLDHSTRLNPHW